MMEKTHDNALILFARDPILGKVKTRLSPFLEEDVILKLYTCFLQDSLDNIRQVKNVDRFVGVAPSNESGFFTGMLGSDIRMFVQEGENLGDKMYGAIQDRFTEGYERVVIIGSDSPSLPVSYIHRAVGSDKDMVLGPSTDGGYYLIGMRGKVVEVFKDVTWGTETVLQETCEHLVQNGASLELLPVWYDVDTPEDLKFFKTHLDLIQQAGLGAFGETGKLLNEILAPH
jgi:rSAM/selenodomain-associated transferase 1